MPFSIDASSKLETIDSLIFDLADLLFEWSVDAKTAIIAKAFRRVLNSATWFDYEKGELTKDQCYSAVAEQLGISSDDVAASFHATRESLHIRTDVLSLTRELKPGRSVVAMSNMAAPNWDFILGRFPECDIFDYIFTSAAAGEWKPNLGFYRHVIQQTGINP